MGNPAKRVRELSAAEIERLVHGAAHYVKVKDEYLAAGS
jgi:carbonic anhydrase/acetyltransferase-like protein (isoleucine patch superfamily)